MKETLSAKERFFATLDRQPVDRLPIASPLQTGTVELMHTCGSYWPKAHSDPELMATLAYGAYDTFGFESVRVPFDVNVEAEAMGCELDYEKGKNKGLDIQPCVKRPAVDATEDFSRVKHPDPYKDGRMPVVLKAVQILKKRLPDSVPVIAAVMGPFVVAGQVRGVDAFMRELIRKPDCAHILLEQAYKVCLSFSLALAEAGADCISIIDPTASPELISVRCYDEFAKKYARSLAGSIPLRSILHICGNTHLILAKMAEVCSGLSISSDVDVADARAAVGPNTALCGNVSNKVLLYGTKSEIEESVRTCIEKGIDILCTECGFPPGAPTENMKIMVEAGKKWGLGVRG